MVGDDVSPPTLQSIRQEWSKDSGGVFISHAHADKDFVRPLAEELTSLGVNVWYDEFELKLGDSFSEAINSGLSRAKFGVLVLSKNFFDRYWTSKESGALQALERSGRLSSILPVWLDIDESIILEKAPLLADRFAIRSSDPSKVANAIVERVAPLAHARVMAQRRFQRAIDSGELVETVVDLSELRSGPVRHTQFSPQFLGRIRLVREVVQPHMSMTLDQWIENFSRDISPHSELIWWEFLSYMQIGLERCARHANQDKIFTGLFLLLMSSGPAALEEAILELDSNVQSECFAFISQAYDIWSKDTLPAIAEARRTYLSQSDF